MKSIKNKIAGRLSLGMLFVIFSITQVLASSHREAPLIAFDPLADNTDVYAFRSPDDPNTITIIANYIPMQLPHGGPNYYSFGENVRYEIHVDNDASTPGDDITYRFTFTKENEDPSTFFNIRLGSQNQKNTYTMEKSTDGGETFTTVISNGVVPAYNVGERSIESEVGLGTTYETLFNNAITTAGSGESVFCGHIEDPFFVDLGGIFDLGDAPRQNGTPRDGLACYNVSTIALKVNISDLQKDGLGVSSADNILDSDFVIGVWASASRQQMRTLTTEGTRDYSGDWVQVSRLGMPLTNEVVIPIGDKDYWNSITPYEELEDMILDQYFYNPELALYMDEDFFASAVPAFEPLRIQENSLGMFDFSNEADGLFPLKNTAALDGTALEDGSPYEDLLLPASGSPRSIDLWPIFHTGVPNARPYQLATGKEGDPLAAGKPFINNFLPNGGDMLRLNMAVPVTDRDSEEFSSMGLIAAAVSGLTDPDYNDNAELEFIPNMDGFPNGRRLEDDVTRIELQAVAGIVLSAIGLFEDDYDPEMDESPVTEQLLAELGYSTGVEENDVPFRTTFPYVQLPFSGTSECSGLAIPYVQPDVLPPTPIDTGDFCYASQVIDYEMGVTANGQPIEPIRLNPEEALGMPEQDMTYNFVSLGFGGSLTLGFDEVALNGDGPDLVVYETTFNNETCDSYYEIAEVSVSQDGENFITVGTTCTNEGGEFDISDADPAWDYISFVRIVDITPMDSTISLDAYDVDGVTVLNGCDLLENVEIQFPEGACFASDFLSYTMGSTSTGDPIAEVRTDPTNALGTPEMTETVNFVSLGYGGELILGFDDFALNGDGVDIQVFETTFNSETCDSYEEVAEVLFSQDGINYISVGTSCTNEIGMFDISDANPDWESISFIKFIDMTPETSVSIDAYDVDGVVALYGCSDSGNEAIPAENFMTADMDNDLFLRSYPNPTEGETVVYFRVPATTGTSVEVFNMEGKKVATLFSQEAAADIEYRVDFNGMDLPNGIYVYRLTTENASVIEKFMIAK